MRSYFLVIQTFISFFILNSDGNYKPGDDKAARRLAPCQACRNLANSFLLGIERTAKSSYGGGDTAWEEENKKVYKDSELRLTEIQEKLCAEISIGKDQCHELALENEEILEEWWKKYRNAGESLFTFLCIERLLVCCPDLHYGPSCTPCTGFPQNVCSGHGKCKGSGTRKGNGDCNCDMGYSSPNCSSCAQDYFISFQDTNKILCSPCHKACKNGCTGPGIKECRECREGWEKDEDVGCLDINECLMLDIPCKNNEFCVNNQGSHSCIPCDASCNGCFGDGPDMCEACAENYVLKDKLCVESSTIGRSLQLNMTRYLTYLGLCIATCIIFQKNFTVAAIIGLFVAIYITVSEYLLNTVPGFL